MDAVAEIKSRLSIEDLVSQYVQLKKKGRTLVGLCPFHNDTHPSFTVSPEKGIAYCFACQTGGDIFSFYQAIEGVDFREALRDLAEKTGVEIKHTREASLPKDEKERLRACLDAALRFFREKLREHTSAQEYVRERGIPPELMQEFELGYAPDSFSDTYQMLLKEGFSRSEVVTAGLGIQKDLAEGRIYDRFRNRLIFPIRDHQGNLVAFGGRTLGDDDAKYINSAESPLYHKASVLYGLHAAKEPAREEKRLVLVEGYFDALACRRIGVRNVVAVCGTALTEEHVKLMKRYAETVLLALDSDRAGMQAAERAFPLLARAGITVHAVTLPGKDPDEAVKVDPDAVSKLLREGGKPYLDLVFEEVRTSDPRSSQSKRVAVERVLPLIASLQLAIEQEHELTHFAEVLGVTETALRHDFANISDQEHGSPSDRGRAGAVGLPVQKREGFSAAEVVLGLLLVHPRLRHAISELIPPEGEFANALYVAVKDAPGEVAVLENLVLPEPHRERATILLLYLEHHGFLEWSEGFALREIRMNMARANREILQRKLAEITQKLQDARKAGSTAEEEKLRTQYQQVLKLAKMAAMQPR